MLIGAGLGVGLFVLAAFAFDLMGFLARDELLLRFLMLIASLFYITYLFLAADLPLWDAILADSVLAGVNLSMIGLILVERSTRFLPGPQRSLFAHFPTLSPGQFRRLLRAGRPVDASASPVLLREGTPARSLYFVSEGEVEIAKHSETARVAAPVFLGEIAYLTGAPASATVRLMPGAVCHAWDHDNLRRLTLDRPAIGTGLSAMMNADLARKLSVSRLGAPTPADVADAVAAAVPPASPQA